MTSIDDFNQRACSLESAIHDYLDGLRLEASVASRVSEYDAGVVAAKLRRFDEHVAAFLADEDRDPLRPARGVAIGVVLGLAGWLVICGVAAGATCWLH